MLRDVPDRLTNLIDRERVRGGTPLTRPYIQFELKHEPPMQPMHLD